MHSSFFYIKHRYPIRRGTRKFGLYAQAYGFPLEVVIGVLEKFEKHGGWKNVRLSTEIAVYLVNGTT